MTTEPRAHPIRRILVGLDASAHSLAALEAVAELAQRLKAELAGLFVEEEDLLRLAALPFARAYSAEAADLVRMDSEAMRRALHVQAERARRALATAASRHRLAWSFRVTRGDAAKVLAEAALECDLLGLGKASAARGRHVRLGSTARATLTRRTCTTLLLQRDGTLGDRVVAVHTGPERTLAAAADLAAELALGLEVVVAGADEADGERLAGDAERWLAGRGLRARVTRAIGTDAERLARVVQHNGRGLIVAAAEGVLAPPNAPEAFAEALDAPFLLLR